MKNQSFLVLDLDVSTRWNSIFLMIEKLKKIREITDILVTSNSSLKLNYPTELEWIEIDMIHTLLESIYQATLMLSSSSYPTLGDLYLAFTTIINFLEDIINTTIEETTQKIVATAMVIKLDEYWKQLDQKSFVIASLDPNIKLTLYDPIKQLIVQQKIQDLYFQYSTSNNNLLLQENILLSGRNYLKKMRKRPYNTFNLADNNLQDYFMSSEVDCDMLLW
ncbi:6523_t:CDS:2 [Acaulospora morrowiae]|uniref:6523_t:CDS:1 n=1 Tax=Acaulospora morrowiae TaxID=94023 RepID=A0A9N9CQT0_9GLOM|nr:6523_t:CDS:2 [Acaulospora morrowiae]